MDMSDPACYGHGNGLQCALRMIAACIVGSTSPGGCLIQQLLKEDRTYTVVREVDSCWRLATAVPHRRSP